MSLGVALSKDETYRKFSRFTNSSIFSMLSKSRGKRDLKDRVAEKMGEKLHSSKKVVKEQFPYMEIMFQNNETAYDLATYYGLTDDEVKLFRSRKIKVKKTKVKKPDTSNIKSKESPNNLKSKHKKPVHSQSEVKTNLKVKKPLKSEKKQKERKIKGLLINGKIG